MVVVELVQSDSLSFCLCAQTELLDTAQDVHISLVSDCCVVIAYMCSSTLKLSSVCVRIL